MSYTKPIAKHFYQTTFYSIFLFFSLEVKEIKPFCKIPGPLHLPVVGSQWLYFWFGPYSLDKLHLANEGNIIIQFQVSLQNSSCFHIPCLIT